LSVPQVASNRPSGLNTTALTVGRWLSAIFARPVTALRVDGSGPGRMLRIGDIPHDRAVLGACACRQQSPVRAEPHRLDRTCPGGTIVMGKSGPANRACWISDVPQDHCLVAGAGQQPCVGLNPTALIPPSGLATKLVIRSGRG
jgi:hypothetical protein